MVPFPLPHIDWDVSIGTILATLTILIALGAAHTANVRRAQAMETKIEIFWEWFKKHVLQGSHGD